jgi:ABC-type transporter MlaC component
MTPEAFAETYRLPVANVYHALAYYDDHPEEMERHREARERTAGAVRAEIRKGRPVDVNPDG